MMNKILCPFLNKFVVVYLNNILIFSKTKEEHLEHVQLVFKALKEAKLYAKPSKCSFITKSIKFCKHIIRNGQVYIEEDKVCTIKE